MIGSLCVDYCLDNYIIILMLLSANSTVRIVKQLLDNVAEIIRQVFAYLASGTFGAYLSSNFYELIKSDDVIVIHVFLRSLNELQFCLWVVDECAELFFLCKT